MSFDERPRVLLIGKSDTRFHRGIVHGVISYARHRSRWHLSCHTTLKSIDQENLAAHGVVSIDGHPEVNRLAHRHGLPIVFIGGPYHDELASSVCCDEDALGEMAAEHLAELGLKHFGFVGHGPWPFVQLRLSGFAKALASRGLAPPRVHMGSFYDGRQRPRFMRGLYLMLRSVPKPCGILAANDAIGVEVISACLQVGLRVPEEIAVLGVDDDELACELSEIPLSSVAQPLYAMGYEAARMLNERIENPSRPSQELQLPPLRVVARASSDLIAIDDPDVAAVLRLINEHYADDINVAWLMQRVPAARRTLERRFKALVGRTMLEQIHHVRLRKAKELLAESDLGVKVVAQRCGFANARWMADTFRRKLRTTPMRFRRQFRTES